MQVHSPCLRVAFTAFSIALLAATSGATEKVLHNFGISNDDGISPGCVIFDGAGNLYGTTQSGGTKDYGTVFEMTPNGSGGWTEKVLHNFGLSNDDGQDPRAGLIFDGAGNLYGVTEEGGTAGRGTVFEMTPNGSGGWTERVLHNFRLGYDDGQYPTAGVIFDGAGNLYGTTNMGGTIGWGTVFEMTPNGSGGWTEKVLHNFGISNDDGYQPWAGVILDGAGNLYGTTTNGGTANRGTVFEMTPNGSGGWTERAIHNFGVDPDDGYAPYAGLIFDGSGNLYSTTINGGTKGNGTVFEMTPNGSGGWTEKVVHNFGISNNDGQGPEGSLIFDGSGNLYGTTNLGGTNADGTVFEMTPNGSGGWTERVLHNFGGDHDGRQPYCGVLLDGAGNLYGTTAEGGTGFSGNGGTAFEVTP